MARVIYGPEITELIGSIGGVTFQRNSSGYIARLKPNTPVNPTSGQATQEYYLSQLVAKWGSLSLPNKAAWDTFATAHTHYLPWGDEKTLNGYQWFISCNLNLLIINQSAIDTPPSWTSVSPVDEFVLSATDTYFRITWSPSIDITGYRLLIYATHPLRMNSEKLRRSILLIRKYDGTTITYLDLKTYYENVFKVTWADLYTNSDCTIIVHCKLIQELTGLASQYTSSLIKIS